MQRRVGQILSSVFQNANTHLRKIFYSNISESRSITTVIQIFQFCLHAVFLLALVFKRASVCNWQHLHLQILYIFQSNYQIISCCFNLLSLFRYLTSSKKTQKHQNNARQSDAFKLLCYFKLTKLREVKITGDSMVRFDLL